MDILSSCKYGLFIKTFLSLNVSLTPHINRLISDIFGLTNYCELSDFITLDIYTQSPLAINVQITNSGKLLIGLIFC